MLNQHARHSGSAGLSTLLAAVHLAAQGQRSCNSFFNPQCLHHGQVHCAFVAFDCGPTNGTVTQGPPL